MKKDAENLMLNVMLEVVFIILFAIFFISASPLPVQGQILHKFEIKSTSGQAKLCRNVKCSDFSPVRFDAVPAGLKLDKENGIFSGIAETGAGRTNFSVTGQKVMIDPLSGQWSGWAWVAGAEGGWLKFDCADKKACVKSAFQQAPAPAAAEVPPPPKAEAEKFPIDIVKIALEKNTAAKNPPGAPAPEKAGAPEASAGKAKEEGALEKIKNTVKSSYNATVNFIDEASTPVLEQVRIIYGSFSGGNREKSPDSSLKIE